MNVIICTTVLFLINKSTEGAKCTSEKSKNSLIKENLLEEGDECVLSNDICGKCLPYSKYLNYKDYVALNPRPPACGFNGTEPLVCIDVKTKRESKEILKNFCDSIYKKQSMLMEEEDDDYENEERRIILEATGGINALPASFPHMAILGYIAEENRTLWGCGGSLISYNFILTAAHCIEHKAYGNVTFVRLGELNLKSENDITKPQDFEVLRTLKHPNYKFPSRYNDIALIELHKAAELGFFVRPGCLETEKVEYSQILFATGWGTLHYGGEPADHLQLVRLKQSKHHECKKHYKPDRRLKNGILDDGMICAGDENQDTCQGDSGGPLQITHFDDDLREIGFKIVGVTSFGKACGISRSPSIYTRVSNYIDWIVEIVWPDE